MMRFTDATKLASTKLRTRKVRLVVTIIVAGMMFSVLASVSMTARGIFDSIGSFNQEGLGDRFIISASDRGSLPEASLVPEVVARATELQKTYIANKVALAKKYGVPYDPKNEPPIVSEIETSEGKQKSVDDKLPAGKQAIQEYYDRHRPAGIPELKQQAANYQAINYFEGRSSAGPAPGAMPLSPIVNGKEITSAMADSKRKPGPIDGFVSSWGLLGRDLLQPFLLPGVDSSVGKDGSIPVIAPFNAIEDLLGLGKLAESATPEDRLERIREVRSKAGTLNFQVCYRNQASSELVSQAASQQQEIAANKNDKDFVKPPVIYGTPGKPCTNPPITTDSRTAAEKQNDSRREQFERESGASQAPQQNILTFRIVGIAPNPEVYGSGSFVASIVSSLLSSNLGRTGANWFTPTEATEQVKQLNEIFPTTGLSSQGNVSYVEFASADQAERFVKEQSCNLQLEGLEELERDPNSDPNAACDKQGKHFYFDAFGSNSLALNSIKKGFSKVFGIAAIIVATVAGIIMIGTVGRTIADSRRETAVFRAIGAKKLDIVQIYLIYTMFLSLLIFSFALLVGLLVSHWIDHRYTAEVTNQALLAYNAQDLTKSFGFHDFYAPDIIRLLGLAIAGGFLSAFFPLLRNLRRNPIRDMRDDT